jgi:uncharacterized RDD family membrane protein YckC
MVQGLYAGFWVRVLASLIDTVILLVSMLMFLASIYPDYFSLDPEAPMYRGPIEVVIQYGVSFSIRCYFGN